MREEGYSERWDWGCRQEADLYVFCEGVRTLYWSQGEISRDVTWSHFSFRKDSFSGAGEDGLEELESGKLVKRGCGNQGRKPKLNSGTGKAEDIHGIDNEEAVSTGQMGVVGERVRGVYGVLFPYFVTTFAHLLVEDLPRTKHFRGGENRFLWTC